VPERHDHDLAFSACLVDQPVLFVGQSATRAVGSLLTSVSGGR
jgi:hypothetical protein